jgi:hypothetical protein
MKRRNNDDFPTPKSPTSITFCSGIFTEAIEQLFEENLLFFSQKFFIYQREVFWNGTGGRGGCVMAFEWAVGGSFRGN